MIFNSDFFDPDLGQPGTETDGEQSNPLLQYLQRQRPEVLEFIAKSISPQAKEIVSQNVQGLVGVLPPEGFEVQIVTDSEKLSSLLASAMVTGYFLRQMEQRMEMEANLSQTSDLGQPPAGEP